LLVLLVFGLAGYYGFKLSFWKGFGLGVALIIILLFLLYFVKKIKPLWIHNFFNESENFIPSLSIASALGIFLLVVILIGGTTISGTITHSFSKHLWRSNYGMVMHVYQNMYSGYPKILIDNSQDKNNTYYVPFEAGGYYYVYDVENVKERYFAEIKI